MKAWWKHAPPRVAFITGGSSGIGLELARRLAQKGASVAIFARRVAPQVVAELRTLATRPGQRIESLAADVADAEALREAFDRAVADMGKPDLVVNAAGIIISAPFADLAAADFERVIAVNLTGSRNVAAAALPHLAPGAHLVLVASLAGLVGNFGYAAYGASKFGVIGLGRALDLELRPKGIDVSICCPGVVLTPMVEQERAIEHPVTRALAEFPGVMAVGPACDALLRGIARRRFLIVPGARPRLSAMLDRLFPAAMRAASHALTHRALTRPPTTDARSNP